MKQTEEQRNQAGALRSAFSAGLLATVIYFVISVATSGFSSGVLLVSLALGAATFGVTWLITTLIGAALRRKR